MPYNIQFKTPFNLIISGMSGSGKTTWVQNLLRIKEQIFSESPSKVFLFYKIMQDVYLEMQQQGLVTELIYVAENPISLDEIQLMVHKHKDNGGCLLIFDDSMTNINEDFENLFCNLGHHENASIIFLTQNLFYQNKTFRTMSLNSHYLVLMKNDRDKQQTSILAKQFSPHNNAFITKAFFDATLKAYSYLILDFRPDTPSNIRVRSRIFQNQFPCTIYLEK